MGRELFEGAVADGFFDEVLDAGGAVGSHYARLVDRLHHASFRSQGITLTVYGEDEGIERTFPARRRAEPLGDDVAGVLLSLRRAGGTPRRYAPGATLVGMPVDEVLTCGEGVCEDFTHLAIALCHSVGIPARYVSGYLFAGAGGGEDTVVVPTHAWIEAALPGSGWGPLDATSHQEVGEQHGKIGHARDHDDVPPLRGVFSGPPEHDMDVRVEMRRTAAAQQQQ